MSSSTRTRISKPATLAIASSVALALSASLSLSTALAEDAAKLAPQRALDSAIQAGYEPTGEIELDDGVYEIEARDGSGRQIEVHVDARNGDILAPLPAGVSALNADRIRERIMAAGYNNIDELEIDDGVWEAEVRDGNGAERKLRLHRVSGEILSDRADD